MSFSGAPATCCVWRGLAFHFGPRVVAQMAMTSGPSRRRSAGACRHRWWLLRLFGRGGRCDHWCRRIRRRGHACVLSQLASRIAATVRMGDANGEDVLKKLKALIRDLVTKWETEAGAEATEKAFWD